MKRRPRLAAALAAVGSILVPGCGAEDGIGESSLTRGSATQEAAADPSRDEVEVYVAISGGGRYRLAVRPVTRAIPLGAMHEWIVEVERTDGAPPRLRRLFFDGGMPAHAHGFVTAPRVTRDLGDGAFLVEGVKFHMPGEWELRVTVIDVDGQHDGTFQLQVAP